MTTAAAPILRLYHATTSPYVRKVMAVATQLGLASQVELLASAAHPINRDSRIATFNPIGKIPAAQTRDGQLLFDSRVICEYLDDYAQGGLFPVGAARWEALARQALGDGLLDAALLARYERLVRPKELQSDAWYQAQLGKVQAALASIDQQVPALASTPSDIGSITLGCALGYLDFRFPDMDWRSHCPEAARWFKDFDTQPAMIATRPYE
ncbi:glutathione S-transferase family protein [Halomonas sp. ATBC28]|uniref:glutathione S-transferase family protein n=1 Tax=Halomonadaceae TaxID=28256 RepID=UPI00110E6A67|nr:glutathione S-transferase family protein [Halomonas sp. ATBC28]TMU18113.1 glutathione S-transferase family protein [Halomonas sp. ATBC28]